MYMAPPTRVQQQEQNRGWEDEVGDFVWSLPYSAGERTRVNSVRERTVTKADDPEDGGTRACVDSGTQCSRRTLQALETCTQQMHR